MKSPSPLPLVGLAMVSWLGLFGLVPGLSASHVPEVAPVVNLNRQLIPEGGISTIQPMDGRVAFILRIELRDYELWVSDGSPGGTVKLRDLCPTSCGVEPRLIASTGTEAFFLAQNDQAEFQLWITDGTLAGTRPLTQLETAGFPPASPIRGGFHWSTELGKLFFSVRQTGVNNQLWTSDGTPQGTQPLLPPSPFDARFLFDDEGDIPGVVLFSTTDELGEEPWRTDGTAQGTERIGDVAEGPLSSVPFLWTPVGGSSVFIASDEDHGRELWITDGTAAGTRLVRDWTAGPEDTTWDGAAGGVGQAFFLARTSGGGLDLIRTDGTSAGTRRIGSFLHEGTPLRFGQSLGPVHAFAATTAELGRELWMTDGTAGGTRPLGDLCPGDCSSDPQGLFRTGDRLAFSADDGLQGRELWISDGTPDGTRQVVDLCPGSCSSNPRIMTNTPDGRLLVLAEDGFEGSEVWSVALSGDPAPVRLSDFTAPQPFTSVLGDSDGGALFTAAELGEGLSLWASNGTPASTRALQRLSSVTEAGSRPHAFVPWQGGVLFTASTPERGHGLWRLAGGTATFVASLETGIRNSFRETLATAVVGDRVFLWSQSDGLRSDRGELWSTRGTPESTRRLQEDIGPVGEEGQPPPVLNGKVFFFGAADNQGLWTTDGNTTVRLYDGRFFHDNSVAVFRDRLYFAGEILGDFGLEQELWVTDGTSAGTRLFVNLAGEQTSDPRSLTVFDSHLYFIAAGGVWRSDGTVDGTTPVAPGQLSGELRELEVVGGRLLAFGADDMGGTVWALDPGAVDGAELIGRASIRTRNGILVPKASVGNVLFFLDENGQMWRTDATPAGTFPVDLVPIETASPVILSSVPGHLLISETASFPEEPRAWMSDGTPAGTLPLTPLIRIGEDVFVSGSRVLLAGNDGQTGLEVWSLSLGGSTPPPPPPPTGPPAAPRRFRAEGSAFATIYLSWEDVSANETGFEIQYRPALEPDGFDTATLLPADTQSVYLSELTGDGPFHFRVRAVNERGVSDWSAVAVATPVEVTFDCLPGGSNPRILCLQDGRFEVRVLWRDPLSGDHGHGMSSRFDFSDDSGTFWFFEQTNVELVVKVLDATTVNGFQWAFYGALSNVEYWVTVTDTQTETNVTYHNPPGNVCGLGDVRAFPRPEIPVSGLSGRTFSRAEVVRQALPHPEAASTETCMPGEEALCLSQERYRVEVDWRDPRSGDEGRGFAIFGTADSGFFWFFDSANVELVVKVLDARTVNGHIWVFFGALTDVEYTVTVTDTQTGIAKEYRNEAGNICGQADVRAF